jgi:hypothetical protein
MTSSYRVEVQVLVNNNWVILSKWDYDTTVTNIRSSAANNPALFQALTVINSSTSQHQARLIYAFAVQAAVLVGLGTLASGNEISIRLCTFEGDSMIGEINIF